MSTSCPSTRVLYQQAGFPDGSITPTMQHGALPCHWAMVPVRMKRSANQQRIQREQHTMLKSVSNRLTMKTEIASGARSHNLPAKYESVLHSYVEQWVIIWTYIRVNVLCIVEWFYACVQ